MFHHFGWKLPIQGQIFRVLGVKKGSNFSFSFYYPKKAHPCAIPRLLSHCISNSVHGLFTMLVREKKNKKVTQKCYISPLCPEVPRERIFTKFGNQS